MGWLWRIVMRRVCFREQCFDQGMHHYNNWAYLQGHHRVPPHPTLSKAEATNQGTDSKNDGKLSRTEIIQALRRDPKIVSMLSSSSKQGHDDCDNFEHIFQRADADESFDIDEDRLFRLLLRQEDIDDASRQSENSKLGGLVSAPDSPKETKRKRKLEKEAANEGAAKRLILAKVHIPWNKHW